MNKSFMFALIGIGCIGALAAAWYMTPLSARPKPQACTMDAKICPDGTAVGRTGPNCEFAACPNGDALFDHLGVATASSHDAPHALSLVYEMPGAPALTRELEFDSASMCASPRGTQACIVFSAPLSYMFGGKRVRVIGIDRGANVLVQRIELQSDDAAPARTTVTVQLGQSATGNGVTITPEAIVEDSRCPADVQCVWAGTVKVRASLTESNATKEVTIERGMSLSTQHAFVTLTTVAPEKTQQEDPSSYRLTFEITAR